MKRTQRRRMHPAQDFVKLKGPVAISWTFRGWLLDFILYTNRPNFMLNWENHRNELKKIFVPQGEETW
jgi:hypothetical protein